MSKNKNSNSTWIKPRWMSSVTTYVKIKSVHDVMAPKSVHDVMALNTYYLL